MNRIKDYAGFAGWFAGLGYIVLWPITAADLAGKPFGAAVVCRDGVFSVLDLLCNSTHPLQLPPGLHALGSMSAVFVSVRLLCHAIKRVRRRGAARTAAPAVPPSRIQIAVPPAPLRPPRRTSPPPPVKPRVHFGLRGVPH